MKRYVTLVLTIIMVCVSSVVYADFTDIPQNAVYGGAVKRLTTLGIMTGEGKDFFKPQNFITREQFSVIMVKAAGLTETAESMKGTYMFSDVSPKSANSGYIAVAIDKGYITGMRDGKFHPIDKVTFAQVCTAIVKALGYTDLDVTGLWPKNYIEKAGKLELTKDISLKSSDGISKANMALIFDRLLETNIKKANASEADKTFATSAGLYIDCIILGNSSTSTKLSKNQVLTDKGTYYLKDINLSLQLGNTYRLKIDDDTIIASYDSVKSIEIVSVNGIFDNEITYNEGYETRTKILPDNTTYYYNGAKQNYDSLGSIIQTRSAIVFVYNKAMTGYDYAVIYDPVYSKPEIATAYTSTSNKIGAIDLNSYIQILKNGQKIDVSQIKENDIIYQVSDIWNLYRYVTVNDSKITGTLSAILPNKLSAKTVQIDSKSYEVSKYANLKKFENVNIGDSITALLDSNGKVVDFVAINADDISNYAFVVNYSNSSTSSTASSDSKAYSVKIMHTDGTTKSYNVSTNPSAYKGRLIKFSKIDDKTINIEGTFTASSTQINIFKDDRKINSAYVTDNVKIYNLISNDNNSDANVSIVNWADLPSGYIGSRQCVMNYVGTFGDASVIVIEDALDQYHKLGYIQSINATPSGNIASIIVNGEALNYSGDLLNASSGSIVRVRLNARGSIASIVEVRNVEAFGTTITAYDSKRIKMNGSIYPLKGSHLVYYYDNLGNFSVKNIKDIDTSKTYISIMAYSDKVSISTGGKIELIIVRSLN